MKTSLLISLFALMTSTLLTAGPIATAVVLDNNGNPTKSVANKAVKLKVADEMIDTNDSIVEKTVKAKVVRGDYRAKRKIENKVK